MRISEQISNGSTDLPRLQKSRSDQGLHLLEPPQATAVLKTRARLCIRIKGGSVQQLLWCMSSQGWGSWYPVLCTHMGTSTCYPRALKIWTDNGDMGVGRKQGGHLPQKSQQELEQHPAKGTHIHSTLNHLIHELEKFSNKSTVNILNTKNLFSKA